MVENERPKRGCLTAFLLLTILGGLSTSMQRFLGRAQMEQSYQRLNWPTPPGWLMTLQGIEGLLYVVAAIGIWKYKKWGVYLFVTIVVLDIVMMAFVHLAPVYLIGALFGLAFLLALVQPQWPYFED